MYVFKVYVESKIDRTHDGLNRQVRKNKDDLRFLACANRYMLVPFMKTAKINKLKG